MSTATKRINARCTSETLTRFRQFQAEHKLSGRRSNERAIQALLDQVPSTPVEVSPTHILALLYPHEAAVSPSAHAQRQEELADIEAACALNHTDLWTILRKGVVREARIQLTQAEKLATADFAAVTSHAVFGQMRKNRLRGSSAVQIESYVKAVMAENVQARTVYDVTYITRGIVKDALHINSTAISAYFAEHAAELDAHHHAVGIHSQEAGIAHNRKRKRVLREREDASAGV
jgi:hypothetical protein